MAEGVCDEGQCEEKGEEEGSSVSEEVGVCEDKGCREGSVCRGG